MIKTVNLQKIFKTEESRNMGIEQMVNLEIKAGEFVASWDHPVVESPPC